MLSKPTTEQFIEYLHRSHLTDRSQLDKVLGSIRLESDNIFSNSELLAQELVRRELITPWHVRQLMKGRYKGFYLRQYRILGQLGVGGMGAVYLAEHTVMQRRVAIKVLPRKRLVNATYLERFIQEAQAIAALDHPNIVRAYDVDRLDDVHYIVMEYFEGVNLRQLVEKEGPIPFEDAVNYIRQAAQGLIHAHRAGIIHRDIKPDNLLVDNLGNLKLLDLGLALLHQEIEDYSQKEDTRVVGTADYLAPEQAMNSQKIDARADIYSLGATLYFCLTGHPPFPFGSIAEKLQAHKIETPKSILIDRPDTPNDLVLLCEKMMEKKPENRFASAAELVTALERWLIRYGITQWDDFSEITDAETESSDRVLTGRGVVSSADRAKATELGDVPVSFRRGSSDFILTSSHQDDLVNLIGSQMALSSAVLNDRSTTAEGDKVNPGERKSQGMTKEEMTAPRNAKSLLQDFKGWSRMVPVWFWALFVAGYFLAFFLAGILFALLANLATPR